MTYKAGDSVKIKGHHGALHHGEAAKVVSVHSGMYYGVVGSAGQQAYIPADDHDGDDNDTPIAQAPAATAAMDAILWIRERNHGRPAS